MQRSVVHEIHTCNLNFKKQKNIQNDTMIKDILLKVVLVERILFCLKSTFLIAPVTIDRIPYLSPKPHYIQP